jgi:hypothetical protein
VQDLALLTLLRWQAWTSAYDFHGTGGVATSKSSPAESSAT